MSASLKHPHSPQQPQPMRDGTGGTDHGPRNAVLEAMNPNLYLGPDTDNGTVPNLKFSFSQAHNRLLPGGWTREVTERELPSATAIAGVNMRLNTGGVRELHWHRESEWAYMTYGRARITAVDAAGRGYAADVGVGDLWYFPAGIPHSIQGLEPDGCEFLLAFSDGSFSENNTFMVTDLLPRMPREVVAKNFGVAPSAFDAMPPKNLYIFEAPLPGPLAADQARSPAGTVPQAFNYSMLAQAPIKTPYGEVRITDTSNFPVSAEISAALVDVEPGAMREIHWHPDSDEWQYYLEGTGRMTVFVSGGKARTFDFQAGDVGVVPISMPHYVENTGPGRLRFLELFRGPRYSDVSLNQWLAVTPPTLVKAHLNLDADTMGKLRLHKMPVVG